ncbi:MAG: rod shape-determining protein MreC [Ruminococcus sp.]|nr:rod shape-determining protein MreC [Ruminococcus sp.]
MLKKKYFYIVLIIIYLAFLMKDIFLKPISNINVLKGNYLNNKEEYYKNEYENLSKMLNIEPNSYDITYSKIITRNIYEFWNKITIAKGSNNNIKKGDIVINEDGVIGLISKVYNNYSEVLLITNNKTNISVKINDSYGILTSLDNKLIVKNIKLNSEIKKDDKIYTSGLTDIPEGLFIGTVSSINKDNLELEYIIEVIPSVNLNNLNYIGVLTI